MLVVFRLITGMAVAFIEVLVMQVADRFYRRNTTQQKGYTLIKYIHAWASITGWTGGHVPFPHFLKWRLYVLFQSVLEEKVVHAFKY